MSFVDRPPWLREGSLKSHGGSAVRLPTTKIDKLFHRTTSSQGPTCRCPSNFLQLLKLGISVSTLYDWLAQSNAGEFEIRGQSITIDYFQGGRRGQGRIQIYEAEIDRLKEAMRVVPQPQRRRRPPVQLRDFPGITVQLGRPDD